MKSTIRIKFLILFILYGFISIFVALIIPSEFVTAPLMKKTAETLYTNATLSSTDYLPLYFSEEVSSTDVGRHLRGMSGYLHASVWFVEKDGTVLSYAKADGDDAPSSVITDFNPTELGNRTYAIGNYHGYFPDERITVIVPVVSGFSPKGYLLVHKSTAEITEILKLLNRSILITTTIIILFALLFLLGVEFFVYYPLNVVTEAAKRYASGDLNYRIPVTSEDEIGYLSASLNYMSEQLRDMDEYQKNFVANVSHDFRSPLTSIKGYVSAMEDGTIPPELYKKYLGIILFETERLTDLTEDLLTLNEFDTKNLLLNKETFDIHDVIKNSANSFEGMCTGRKISIELLFAAKQLPVYADKRKIQQVLYNLLHNAIKFSPNDSVITVETSVRGEKVEVAVKDNGIGIPRNEINKIWERFYKSDLSRGRDKKGTGLGLSIVKEAISAHGENIHVISTEGVGTEFKFTLPRGQ